MKRFNFNMILLIGVFILPVCGMLIAGGQQPPQFGVVAGTTTDEVELVHGTIRQVDADRNIFVLATGEEGEEVTFRVTGRTQYTLDGEESSREETLREGHEADVSHRNNVALQVDARTASPPAISSGIADVDDDTEIVSGSIKRVDNDRDELIVSTSVPGEEVTVRLTEETVYTLNGEELTRNEVLRVGRRVDVRHRNQQALRVDAKTESTWRAALSDRTAPADDEAQIARGRVQSVDARRNRFVLSTEEDEEMTFRINAQTQYTLDGEESTREEALREGRDATVMHRNNLAIRVDALTRTD